ncbi:MAG: aromatic ring-hydroxylating dioxygenase subunit alpha [Candidatus Binatia bacterium]
MSSIIQERLGRDGGSFADAVKPLSHAWTLPPWCYTSREFYDFEVRNVLMNDWVCVGRADQVPKPGDYMTMRLFGEPLVVVRDLDGQVRVLSTVCRHRGMEVVQGQGNLRNFECPYHAWTYSLRGELMGAPEMGKSAGFDRKSCALPSLPLEQWEGFLFVNLDGTAAPLAPRLAPLSEQIRNWRPSEMQALPPLVYECPWNWKVMVENFIECYHHLGLHRQSIEPAMPGRMTWTEEWNGQWVIVHLPTVNEQVGLSGDKGLSSDTPFPTIQTLDAQQRREGVIVVVLPIQLMFMLPDSMVYYHVFPEDVDRITLRITVCVPPESRALPDFESRFQMAIKGIETFNSEDMQACASVQRGLSSRYAAPGRYSHLEDPVWQVGRFVAERIQAALRTAAA